MKKTINISIMIVASIAIILTAVLCTFAYYRVFREEVLEELAAYTRLLSDADPENISEYANELSKADIRLTLIDKNGEVIFDNVASDVESLENHRSRAEISDAIENGEGYSIRRSSTINRSNYYCAVKLHDGSILRTSKQTSSIYSIFGHAFPVVAVIIIVILIMCFAISHNLTKRILKPIKNTANHLSDDNIPDDTYDELRPIIDHIKEQHADLVHNADIRQEFTANVSHELKTPLTSISGYSELIESGMTDEASTRKFAGEIHHSADRLLTLINDILRLSELDTLTERTPGMEMTDIYEIALVCKEMLYQTAEKYGVNVYVFGEKTFVFADKAMMEELVYNLCSNAIIYNHPGGNVWITVEDNVLTVRDDGIGISEEHLDRIFERFYRVDKSRSKKTGGTGLGLAIVKHIVELHNAKIQVESTEGKGTVIKISF